MRTITNKVLALVAGALMAFSCGANDAGLDIPSMEDLIHFKKSVTNGGSTRVKALRQVGIAAGAQAGFAKRATEITAHYCLVDEDSDCGEQALKRKHALDGIFMFRPLIDPRGFLPPVITEVERSSNVSANRMVISGRVYRMDRPARFVSNAMSWRDYLTVGLDRPEMDPLPDTLRPKSNAEKKEWTASIEAGWKIGFRRADDVFQANLDKLKTDYTGMLRYQRLKMLGLVDEPIISRDIQTSQTTPDSITNSLETLEIQVPAQMNGDRRKWKPELTFDYEPQSGD